MPFDVPSVDFSATRTAPRSRRSSASSTASRTSPLVDGPISSRRSKAASMVLARLSAIPADMETDMKSPLLRGLSGQGRAMSTVTITLAARGGEAAQKTGKVVGDMIDVRSLAAGELPFLAQYHAGAFRHHQHRRHAERMRHFEIAGEVFEDRSAPGIDLVMGEEALVDIRAAELEPKPRPH